MHNGNKTALEHIDELLLYLESISQNFPQSEIPVVSELKQEEEYQTTEGAQMITPLESDDFEQLSDDVLTNKISPYLQDSNLVRVIRTNKKVGNRVNTWPTFQPRLQALHLTNELLKYTKNYINNPLSLYIACQRVLARKPLSARYLPDRKNYQYLSNWLQLVLLSKAPASIKKKLFQKYHNILRTNVPWELNMALSGDPEMLDFIMTDSSLSRSAVDPLGTTLAHACVWSGNEIMSDRAKAYGIDLPEARDNFNRSVAFAAVWSLNPDMLDEVASLDVPLQPQPGQLQTFYDSMASGDSAEMDNAGVLAQNMQAMDQFGITPAHACWWTGNLAMIKKSLQLYPHSERMIDLYQRRAIHAIGTSGNPDALDEANRMGLMRFDKERDAGGMAVAHTAALSHNPKMLKKLSGLGTNIHATPNIVHEAAKTGYAGMLTAAVTLGLNVTTKNRAGLSTVYYCIMQGGNPDTLDELHALGVDLNETDSQGRTAVHYAAQSDNTDMLDKVQSLGANIHATDKKDNGIMYYAQKSKNPLQVKKANVVLDTQEYQHNRYVLFNMVRHNSPTKFNQEGIPNNLGNHPEKIDKNIQELVYTYS